MLVRDLRYAVRMLARSPGFSAIAVLSIALGMQLVASLVLNIPSFHPDLRKLASDTGVEK